MKTRFILLSFLLALFSLSIKAQIAFDPGYFVKNNGDTVTGLIKNLDWKNNPVAVEFKKNLESESLVLLIDSIAGFGVGGDIVFKKFLVDIEVLSPRIEDYGYKQNPEYSQKVVLLRQLIEGEKELYTYNEGNFQCFFAGNKGDIPRQLVHKHYKAETNQIAENNQYRNQLYVLLNCSYFRPEDFEKLDYQKKDIINLFENYYTCSGKVFVKNEVVTAKKRKKIELGVSAGVEYCDMEISGVPNSYFPPGISPLIGMDFESFMPFYRNKISFVCQPVFDYYSATGTFAKRQKEVDLFFFTLPFGIRYSSYLRPGTRIFAEAKYSLIFPVHGTLGYYLYDLKPEKHSAFDIGAGIKKGRSSIKLNYRFHHDLYTNYNFYLLMSNASVSYSYTIFSR